MLTYSINVHGLADLDKQFQKAPELVRSHITTAMNKSLVRLHGTAKELVPVDQGTLRGSLIISPVTWSGSTATGNVGTNLHYAVYQEQGTGIYGPSGQPIRPKTKTVLAWQKNGAWHFARQVRGVRPKWYMRTSAERNEQAVNGYFATAMDEVARALTGGAQ